MDRIVCPNDDCEWMGRGSLGKIYNYCPLCGAELEGDGG